MRPCTQATVPPFERVRGGDASKARNTSCSTLPSEAPAGEESVYPVGSTTRRGSLLDKGLRSRFTSSEADLHRYQQGLMSAREQLLFPVKVLKRNAIDLSYLFEMQSTTPAARPPPQFKQVFDDIKQAFNQWEPSMSLGFLKELKLEVLVTPPLPVPSGTPSATPGGSPKKGEDNQVEDAPTSNPHFLEGMFGE